MSGVISFSGDFCVERQKALSERIDALNKRLGDTLTENATKSAEMMGGIQTLTGAVAGAAVFTWLQDTLVRQTEYFRALLGAIILFLVLVFPQGIAGTLKTLWERRKA